MNRIKGIITVFLTVCLAVSAAGCDIVDTIKREFTGTVGETNGTENVKTVSNSISLGMIDFDTFNPLVTKSETVKECMQFVYEPLFELNEYLEAVPVLAEGYTVSADGRTVDITLKDNVLWHDGSAFTAYDAAYTIKQIRAGVTTYTGALANMADYTATGDHSLRIVLNYAVPNFAALLTFPIVQQRTDMRINASYVPVGTGAFRYETQLSTGKLSFIAFDNYHKGKAKINNMYLYTVPDIKKYESMFEANEIDLMTGETVDLSEYTPRGNAKNNEYITNKMTFLGYNLQNSLLGGTDTRSGLSELINKDGIVNSVIYSRGVACDVPINPSSVYYYDTNTKFQADEVLAAQRLGNDNWGMDDKGAYVRRAGGGKETLKLELLTNSDSAEKVSIANYIAEDFNGFGVSVTVTALPYEEYMARINAKNYDLMIGEMEISANLDLSSILSSTDNYFSYRNVNLDMLIGQMGMTSDSEQLKTLFVQYGETVRGDVPFTPLFFRKGNVLSGSKIKNQVVPAIGRFYRDVETWSVM